MNLDVTWTKHLPKESKAEFEKVVRGSTVALRRLKEIAKEWETELSRAEVSVKDYDTASWAAKQAHRNGQRQAYKQLSDLLSFLKD
jgi:hypothetical protein